MKTITYSQVALKSGYLFDKEELNRKVTIDAVYNRFHETGRIDAFNFDYKDGDEKRPHMYWDSDVAKWMEGACYVLKKHSNPELRAKVDSLVEKIKEHQGEDGYFNIYHTVCHPERRFKERDNHELYCAGHLMEAAIAYSEVTGNNDFLECMERYADYIKKVFVDEKSANFISPGHEEIELALVKMYVYTGKKKFLDLAEHFINTRGTEGDLLSTHYQSHMPVREQTEAMGHAVRAVYLYTGMAKLAKHTGDAELVAACKRIWDNVTLKKMYVTGGIGSLVSEAFSVAYDLPNDTSYAETCAGIGLMFFAQSMLEIENDARYADVIERVLYNGVLSGISIDGQAFFYENPLEINLIEQADIERGKRRFPITQRRKYFSCSCCPPNLNRLLSSLGNYVYGHDDDTLFVNQYISSELTADGINATLLTEYPNKGTISIKADGVKRIALRIPSWCDKYSINKPYTIEDGYAVVENDGCETVLELSLVPKAIYADPRVFRNAGKICFMRGPIVYCAEGVDNSNEIQSYRVLLDSTIAESYDPYFGLVTLTVAAKYSQPFDGVLYSANPPKEKDATIKLIPYSGFANRGISDMRVWLRA